MIKEVKNSGRKRLNKTLLASVLVMSLLNDVSTCLAETGPIMNSNDSRLEVKNVTELQKENLSMTITSSSIQILDKVWLMVLEPDQAGKLSSFKKLQSMNTKKKKLDKASKAKHLEQVEEWLGDKKEEIKHRNGNPALIKERLSVLDNSSIRHLERIWQIESGLYPDFSDSSNVNYMWREHGLEKIAPEQHYEHLNKWLSKKVGELQQIRLGLKE